MGTKVSLTTTIRRMKEDDLACQIVMRYQQDRSRLHEDNIHTRTVRELARKVINEKRYPETVGEWIGLVLYNGDELFVNIMREDAERSAQASYMQAVRWLEMIDRAQAA